CALASAGGTEGAGAVAVGLPARRRTMNRSKRMDRNERIGAALRRGDPASEETGLSPAEAQAMRRAVLSAATEPRWAFRWAPAFAAGAVAVLSLAVGLSLWRMRGPAPVSPVAPAPVQPAPSAAVSVPPAFPSPTVVAVVVPPPPAHTARRREPARPPGAEARPETTAPTLQVQFSTAGGTRIIWLLPETTSEKAR